MRRLAFCALAASLASTAPRQAQAGGADGAPGAGAPADHAADLAYDPAAMARARAMLAHEHGGMAVGKVMLDEAELQPGGDGAYRWNAEAWYGGDLDRLVLKSQGEGARRERLEAAEVQALWSRAVSPYADLQLGLRQDLAPRARTYATAGVEALLPYWIAAGGALFLSTKGDVLARAEASYDLRLTRRLVLQPRAELNFAARDVAETRTGAGLARSEVGLRLRYEIRPELAPYVGVVFDRRHGRTADYARADGERVGRNALVLGLRAWF
jgi:copper resistance protein B